MKASVTIEKQQRAQTAKNTQWDKKWELKRLANRIKQFGSPLKKLNYSDDEEIPDVLVRLRLCLLSNGGLQVEGVFRVEPNKDYCALVKQQLNEGTFITCDDVHVCASLLKAWLRDLPKTDKILGEFNKVMDIKHGLTEVIQMDSKRSKIFLWYIDLAVLVVNNAGQNRMGAENLAKVFSPNLIPPCLEIEVTNPEEGEQQIQVCKDTASFIKSVIEWRMDGGQTAKEKITERIADVLSS